MITVDPTFREVLTEDTWRERQRDHDARVRAWTDPHHERARRGIAHPVHDFLFTYYSLRPAWLRRWHPGPDFVLSGPGAHEFLRWPEYQETSDGIQVDPARMSPGRRQFVEWLGQLLTGMQGRPAAFGCHGLHEWAMVYRQSPDELRHHRWPLRLPPPEIARIVEQATVRCTHFDAFRFFTADARPLNRLQPTRATVPELEQRGCLHANMDLYKWAFKLAPFSPSELVADCFALARDLREVDMRASPYDFRSLGYAPIAIETAGGRSEYEALQRDGAARAEPLRRRLIALCERLVGPGPAPG